MIRNVQTIDGTARVFYANTAFDAAAGTFLVNTSGELIGWATDKYTEKSGSMATVWPYRIIRESWRLLSNGVTPPYFGIKGQDVSQAMEESGMPKGVYVTEAVAEQPGLQRGHPAGGCDYLDECAGSGEYEGLPEPGGEVFTKGIRSRWLFRGTTEETNTRKLSLT